MHAQGTQSAPGLVFADCIEPLHLWLPSGEPGVSGDFWGSQEGCQGPSPWVGPGKPNLPLGLRGKAGGGARVTAGL